MRIPYPEMWVSADGEKRRPRHPGGMRILLALGAGGLDLERAVAAIAALGEEHEVVVVHGQPAPVAHQLELALRNRLPERDVVSVLSQVVLAGEGLEPTAIAEIRSLRALVAAGALVVCAAGARTAVTVTRDGSLELVDAALDEDRVAELLARRLDADLVPAGSWIEAAVTLAE